MFPIIRIMNILQIRMRKMMHIHINIMNRIRIINQKQNNKMNKNHKCILNSISMIIRTYKIKHFLKCILMLILMVKEV